MAGASILYKGSLHPASVPIVSGHDVHMKGGGTAFWSEGHPDVRKRDVPIRAVVLHHTAGEGDATSIFRTLTRRKLSVHFTIDRRGTVVQHADVALVTEHAGGANPYSVGIEIASLGFPGNNDASRKSTRKRYVHPMHKTKAKEFFEFYEAQIVSAFALCDSLCKILDLPFVFPTNPDGTLVFKRIAPELEATYRGLLGHFHVYGKKVKCDPSPHLLHEMLKMKAAA